MFATDGSAGTSVVDAFAIEGTIEERLVATHAQLNVLQGAWLALVGEYDRSGAWQTKYLSAAAGLRDLCRMNPGHAAADVHLARKLRRLDRLRSALAAGEVSRPHVQVIADAYTPEREADLAPLEGDFVAAAKTLEPRRLRNVVRYATDAIDGDDGAATDEQLDELSRWHQSKTLHGMLKIDALLAPEAARYWEAGLDAALEREHVEGDERSPAQQRADAATSIVRGALDRGELGNHRRVRPHLTEVIDVLQIPGIDLALVEIARAERRTLGRLSRATLDALLCDSTISRIVMAGPSEILDVGRATRTVSAAQWKALVARDGHCQHPRCTAPPSRCEAHHIQHWEHGGTTDLENLQLLCWTHHRQHHRKHARDGRDAIP